ncbi:MAG: hypothetical protein ACERLM_09910 [Acidimicrobiales bacterium]
MNRPRRGGSPGSSLFVSFAGGGGGGGNGADASDGAGGVNSALAATPTG